MKEQVGKSRRRSRTSGADWGGARKRGAEAPQFSVDVRTFNARQGFPALVARSIELKFVATIPAIEVNVLVVAPTPVAEVAAEVEPIQNVANGVFCIMDMSHIFTPFSC